ncbi:ZIP family metal transporter [Actinocorallia sp. A-T 12471]|uniref:ZIP family metal transporter n=1 Tax=Actinocorallia sp. A-T 12471 TaxID=3089813 RepID=UPI0029CF5750|nr:ZIP family metal transporter [Actinocorallia sp. A-T 12471]MDX6742918.1 ZIP family metal transporter [Actinocorallia sp. A-T 12471]
MAILVAAVAALATLFGGWVAARTRDRRHLVLGFAAGLMLGVVGFDLVPEAMEYASFEVLGVPAASVGIVAGFLTIHVIERGLALHRAHEAEYGQHRHELQRIGLLSAGGLILHSALDGFGIGIGFQAGTAVGVSVAIAVIAHDFADGFNTFTLASLYGNGRARSLALVGADALAPIAGAALGSLFQVPDRLVGLYLGYFAGFLLYLATADILPEAHARHPSRLTLLCTVAGALAMWVVVGISHRH